MSIQHSPAHLSFLFVDVSPGISIDEAHTINVRSTLDHWSKEALDSVLNESGLSTDTVTPEELGQQLHQRCQDFIKTGSGAYSHVNVEYELKIDEQINPNVTPSMIHQIRCWIECKPSLADMPVLNEEERAINFIADLFDGFAAIELIERIDDQDHFMHMTSGKGQLESTPFFEEPNLSIHVRSPRDGVDHTFCLSKTSPVLHDFFDELPASSRATPGARRDATRLLIESEIYDALGSQGLHGLEFEVEDRSQQTGMPTMTFTVDVPEVVKLDFGRLVRDMTESPLGLLQSD